MKFIEARLALPSPTSWIQSYEAMEVSADTGLLRAVFSPEPGSRSAEALDLLASWTATPEPVQAQGPS